jgi:hypothetical protein
MAKFTGATTLTSSAVIYESGSSIGIGTTPTEKLDVYGSVRFRTALQSDSYYATFAQNAYYTGAWLKYASGYARTIELGSGISFKISNAGAGNAGDAITFITPMTITDTGSVGISSSAPSEKLYLQSGNFRMFDPSSNANAGYQIQWASNAGGSDVSYALIEAMTETNATRSGNLRFYTSSNAFPSERMRITSGGFVGIGTTSPSYNLDVNTSIRVFNTVSGSTAEFRASGSAYGGSYNSTLRSIAA